MRSSETPAWLRSPPEGRKFQRKATVSITEQIRARQHDMFFHAMLYPPPPPSTRRDCLLEMQKRQATREIVRMGKR